MQKECLLIIDMQVKFLRDKKPADLLRKLAIQKSMIAHFEKQYMPIVYTIFEPKKFGPIIQQLRPPDTSQIVVKQFTDGFEESNLDDHLNGYDLHVVGCNFEACVQETVESALQLGYSVSIYRNAVLTNNSSLKKMAEMLFRYALTPQIKLPLFKVL